MNSFSVSLTWKLHFEFVTTKEEEIQNTEIIDSQGTMKQGPESLKVQTMIWDLPICVYPTHPIQIARGLQIPATSMLAV